MPLYDYQCIVCGQVRKDVLVSNWHVATQRLQQCACGGEMRRLPAAPNHVVNGFNAKNGYSNG